MRSLFLCVLVVASLVSEARADEPLIEAPVAVGDVEVPYPDGAAGDAAVRLELIVEADGAVSEVVVVEGEEPFASRARGAAAGWTFTPARREGVAVRARVAVRVEFHPELPKAPPAVAPVVAAPAVEQPLEVTVRGRRREAGQTTLSIDEVRALPGAFGDPFRAVEVMPSVVPLISGVPYFFIRGAPPNNNGYTVDGIRVPLLFHLGLAQGVIHPGLIDRVDFFPGAAPAAYGGVTGGLIAGQTREPGATRRVEANLRLIDAGALVESPFSGDRGNVLVAGRYGYPGPILGALTSGLSLGYWDYQARLSWRLSERDTLAIFAFGSHDYLATPSPSADPTARPVEQFDSKFHRVDLRYDRALTDGHLRVALTGGIDRQGASPTYIRDDSMAVRVEIDKGVTSTVRVRGGATARLDAYRLTQEMTGPNAPAAPGDAEPPPTNLVAGAHVDAVWAVTPRLELTPGVRFDLFASSRGGARTSVPAFDPRLSARVTITPSVAWLSAVGIAHQYPALRVGNLPAPILTVPGFPVGQEQLQAALQVSEGLEMRLPADITVTTAGFFTRWTGLTDLTAMCVEVSDGGPSMQTHYVCPDSGPVSGHAYGFELMARRSFSRRVSGWLAYTLSRSIRDARFITPAGAVDLATVSSESDRRHVVNAALSFLLGTGWRLGGRGIFYTGAPYSRLDGVLPVPPYNAYRTPSFYRLDVRLEKRWPLGQTGSIALVIEGQNVTLNSEYTTAGLDCMDSPGMATQCRYGKIGPLTLPSVGVEAFF